MKKQARAQVQAVVPTPATTLVSPIKPLVFVSHDSRDASLAEMFGNLLTDASGGIVKSFRSSDRKGTSGIEFGAEWYTTIMAKIGDATDVVALLTHHSVDRPWILYEAGVAKGRLNTTVFGLAIGIPLDKASGGPFAQFQNSGDDEDSLTKLVLQLIQKNPDASPREEAVRRQVKAFRENVVPLLKESSKTKAELKQQMDETAIAKMFEEVKVMFGELPDIMQRSAREGMVPNAPSRRLGVRFADRLLLRERPGSPVPWLVFVNVSRNLLPWLYEPGMELYRALVSQRRPDIKRAQRNLRDLLRYLNDSSLVDLLAHEGFMDKREYRAFRELFGLLEHYLSFPFEELAGRKPSKPEEA